MAEGVAAAPGSPRTGDESSESENETEPAKIFHRKLSTKRNVKSALLRSYSVGCNKNYFLAGIQGLVPVGILSSNLKYELD
ncbi:conserved hypothetical protein [Culex quinquefasciatus]|uniref:Uncharacterized protein n=1 Tax=Culex quinquefasciatus TaxID=7176 RepID=B0X2Q9_CULQU|nr:conserved hypothetical protein [Culex quinquefasciatus]|eukprot:XP_001863931.1 conserved hypothetical protein [Culex quinquefasciatus]